MSSAAVSQGEKTSGEDGLPSAETEPTAVLD
jgi:hypothetical protein